MKLAEVYKLELQETSTALGVRGSAYWFWFGDTGNAKSLASEVWATALRTAQAILDKMYEDLASTRKQREELAAEEQRLREVCRSLRTQVEGARELAEQMQRALCDGARERDTEREKCHALAVEVQLLRAGHQELLARVEHGRKDRNVHRDNAQRLEKELRTVRDELHDVRNERDAERTKRLNAEAALARTSDAEVQRLGHERDVERTYRLDAEAALVSERKEHAAELERSRTEGDHARHARDVERTHRLNAEAALRTMQKGASNAVGPHTPEERQDPVAPVRREGVGFEIRKWSDMAMFVQPDKRGPLHKIVDKFGGFEVFERMMRAAQYKHGDVQVGVREPIAFVTGGFTVLSGNTARYEIHDRTLDIEQHVDSYIDIFDVTGQRRNTAPVFLLGVSGRYDPQERRMLKMRFGNPADYSCVFAGDRLYLAP